MEFLRMVKFKVIIYVKMRGLHQLEESFQIVFNKIVIQNSWKRIRYQTFKVLGYVDVILNFDKKILNTCKILQVVVG